MTAILRRSITRRRRLIETAAHAAQLVIVRIAAVVASTGRTRSDHRTVLVGLEENAGILHHLSQAIPGSISAKLNHNKYYDHAYDVDFSRMSRPMRLLWGPITLGRLVARVHTVIYVGGSGFLINADGREGEFRFLQSRGVRIICQFTGSDVRSYELLTELGRQLDRDVVTTYQPYASPGFSLAREEERRRLIAVTADKYAAAIFNPSADQAAHINRATLPFLHFFPDDEIAEHPSKWPLAGLPLVVHAPSSPIIKGTPLVRAAVKALHEDGYEFEYRELTNLPNTEVRAILRDAHIVLNEFYAFVPGVLGVEAMASNAVLMTAADPDIEPTLGEDARHAWIVTPYWRIKDELAALLEDSDNWQSQADRGTQWARDHCSASACRAAIFPHLGEARATGDEATVATST